MRRIIILTIAVLLFSAAGAGANDLKSKDNVISAISTDIANYVLKDEDAKKIDVLIHNMEAFRLFTQNKLTINKACFGFLPKCPDENGRTDKWLVENNWKSFITDYPGLPGIMENMLKQISADGKYTPRNRAWIGELIFSVDNATIQYGLTQKLLDKKNKPYTYDDIYDNIKKYHQASYPEFIYSYFCVLPASPPIFFPHPLKSLTEIPIPYTTP